jgi:dolichol-phosphate mannosyltransferase
MNGDRVHVPLAIVAAMNEEEGIGPTIAELRQYVKNVEVLVVDGNSRDDTVRIAEDMNANVIFQEGRGKGDAIAQAIRHINLHGIEPSYVAFTDADYTYPAEFMLPMIEILNERPSIGMVCGNRFNSHFHLEAMHDMFYAGNRFLAFAHNLMNGVALRDPLTGLRVLRWEIIRDWVPKATGFDIEVELNHQVERKKYDIVEIPIAYRARMGEKKLKMRHGATILRRILMETGN